MPSMLQNLIRKQTHVNFLYTNLVNSLKASLLYCFSNNMNICQRAPSKKNLTRIRKEFHKSLFFSLFISYSIFTSYRSWRSLLDEEWSRVSSLLWTEMEESIQGPVIEISLCIWLSCENVENCVWLSCDNFPKALNLASGFVSLRLIIGAWTAIFPSIILTTEDIDGLRVGEGLVHKRAKLSILNASSEE